MQHRSALEIRGLLWQNNVYLAFDLSARMTAAIVRGTDPRTEYGEKLTALRRAVLSSPVGRAAYLADLRYRDHHPQLIDPEATVLRTELLSTAEGAGAYAAALQYVAGLAVDGRPPIDPFELDPEWLMLDLESQPGQPGAAGRREFEQVEQEMVGLLADWRGAARQLSMTDTFTV